MDILAKIKDFVNSYFNDIILFIIAGLLILLAFAAGYMSAKYSEKQPILIEQNSEIK